MASYAKVYSDYEIKESAIKFNGENEIATTITNMSFTHSVTTVILLSSDPNNNCNKIQKHQ